MKLGFNEATCMKKSDVMNDIVLCEKYGYDYIELRIDMLKKFFEKNKIKDLQNFFASSHIKPFGLNSIENINFTDKKQWLELTDMVKFACEVSQGIGSKYLVVVPTMGKEWLKINEKIVFDDSIDVLTQLADLAKPYGVKLAFEPIGDARWCCTSLRQGLEIVKALNRDDVGLAIDCINFYLHDKCSDLEFIKNVPLEKLFIYHINDCEDLPLGILDHCHRLFPGDGCIPIAAMTKNIKNLGYDDIVSLELFRPEYWEMDPEDVIKIGAEKTRLFF